MRLYTIFEEGVFLYRYKKNRHDGETNRKD